MANTDTSRPWWGNYQIGQGETAFWRIGGSRFWVHNGRNQWHFAVKWEEGDASGLELNVPFHGEIPSEVDMTHCFGSGSAGNGVTFEPRLPDRPLVWRPLQPLSIAPGEAFTLFLRAPLWLGLRVEGIDQLLWEGPLHRLSDTWVGPPTEDGGFAYSADGDLLLRADEIPVDGLHAITPIDIKNSTGTLLHVQRLNLPAPYLSLFARENAGVWTQRVMFERRSENDEADLLRLEKKAPKEMGNGSLLARPRMDAEKHAMFQAFSKLFS